MRRITIRLDEDLLAAAKAVAARSGKTLAGVIEDALRVALAHTDRDERAGGRFRLPTFGRGGPHPGVNLDSNAALLDLMDDWPIEERAGSEDG